MKEGVLTITWLGHGTFLFETPGGKRILLDPWIEGNPAFPAGWQERLGSLDAILLSHGHFDHSGSLLETARSSGAQVACIFELALWLGMKGIENTVGFNKGGMVDLAGVKVTMTDARHSSAIQENDQLVYLGEACGYVLEFEDGFTLYHTGDTCVFGDMALIGELYQPNLVILPIGDVFTMGPRQAAHALKLIGAARAIPEHYGTFPLLTGTPQALRDQLAGTPVEVVELTPGVSWVANPQ